MRCFLLFCALFGLAIAPARAQQTVSSPVTPAQKSAAQVVVTGFLRALERRDYTAARGFWLADSPQAESEIRGAKRLARSESGLHFADFRFKGWNWNGKRLRFRLELARNWRDARVGALSSEWIYLWELEREGAGFRIAARDFRTPDLITTLGFAADSRARTVLLEEENRSNPLHLAPVSPADETNALQLAQKLARCILARDGKAARALSDATAEGTERTRNFYNAARDDNPRNLRGVRLIFPRFRIYNGQMVLRCRALVTWDWKGGRAETFSWLLTLRRGGRGFGIADARFYLDHNSALATAPAALRGEIFLDDYEAARAAFSRPLATALQSQIESDIRAFFRAHLAQNEAGVRAAWLPETDAPDLTEILGVMKDDAKFHKERVIVSDFARWHQAQDEGGALIGVRARARFEWQEEGAPAWNERWWNFTLRRAANGWKIAAAWKRHPNPSRALRLARSVEERARIVRDEHFGEVRTAASPEQKAAAQTTVQSLVAALATNDRAALQALCAPDSSAFANLRDNLDDAELRAAFSTLGAPKMGEVARVSQAGKTTLEVRFTAPMTIGVGADPYGWILVLEPGGGAWRVREQKWRDADLLTSLRVSSIATAASTLDGERGAWNRGFLEKLWREADRRALAREQDAPFHLVEAALQLAAFLGDPDTLGEAYQNRAHVIEIALKGEARGESGGIADDLRRALRQHRAAGNRALAAIALVEMADEADSVSRYDLALRFSRLARESAQNGGDAYPLALALQRQGDAQKGLGQNDAALSSYQEMRRVAQQNGFSDLEIEARGTIGAWRFNRGQVASGLAALQGALELAREAKLPTEIADTLRALAQGAVQTGQLNEAVARLEAAQLAAQEARDPALEFDVVQNLRAARGERYIAAGAPDLTGVDSGAVYNDAISVLTLSIEMTRLLRQMPVSIQNEDKAARATLRQTRWTLRVAALLSPEKARAFVEDEDGDLDALEAYARKRGDRDLLADVQLYRGELRRLQGRFDEGLAQLQQAREYQSTRSDSWTTLSVLARFEGDILRDQKNWARAADAYRASIAATEKMRAGAGEARLQSGILAGNVASYQRLAECLWRLGAAPPQFLGAVEAGRARALTELLQNGGATQIALSPPERERQNELESRASNLQFRLDALSSQVSGAAPQAAHPPIATQQALTLAARELGASEGFGAAQQRADSPETLRAQLQNARLELDAYQSALAGRHPQLRPPAPASMADFAALFRARPNRRVLMFQVGDQSTLLLALRAETGADGGEDSEKSGVHLDTFEIRVSRPELRRRVAQARKGLSRPSSVSDDWSELRTLLLGGAQKWLEGAGELVIIPDDCLAGLPFAALNDEDGTFLIQKFPVSYAPGLSALLEMEKRAAALNSSPQNGRAPFLGLSRSDFTEIGLKTLPGTHAEVAAIAPLFGARAVVAQDGKATKAFARRELPGARLIHLATHGLLNEQAPLYSSVALAPGPTESDGRLYARDLMQMNLQADLVVLSACETALGQEVRGEGVLGLTWALFVAGTPTSIVTQWSVDDTATSALMQNFYGELKSGKAPAVALRDAQLSLLKSKTMKHPAYWAPFIVVGAAD